MRTLRTIAEVRTALKGVRREGRSIGFVPTMGALHEGHLQLIREARQQHDEVVVSIFVNPTQFDDPADLAAYPRVEASDAEAAAQAGADLLFAPAAAEMYPDGFATTVHVDGPSARLEGASRPGHFDGVATVVCKLLNIVGADIAYFGQKDAQQLAIIRRMTRDLLLPVEVVGCPTVREDDGLACSSRNIYLDEKQRGQAPALFAGLVAAERAFADGVRDAETLRRIVRERISAEPLASIDYISLADASTLRELAGDVEAPALLSMAVAFGATHLLDNTTLVP